MTGVATSWVRSPRARRRLIWLGALVAAGAVTALVFALLPNDNGGIVTPTSNEPVQQVKRERQVPLTASGRAEIDVLLDRFVSTAVARRDPGAAYDLVTPSLRSGTTRTDWRAGIVPAPTYDPSGVQGWRLIYSYRNVASVELTVQPGKTEHAVGAFVVDLKRIGSRWLVDGIYERATYAGGGGKTATTATATETTPTSRPIGGSRGRLGMVWLLIPLGFLSLIVIVPLIIFLSGWLADRRVARKYRGELRRELPPLPRPPSPPPADVAGRRTDQIP